MGWEVFCLGCFLSTTFSLPPSQSRGPLASLRGAAGNMAPRCCTIRWGRCCSPCLLRLLLSGCVLRGAVEAGAASGTRVSAAALGATAALPLRVLRVVLSARSHLPGPPPHGNRPRSSLGASLASERLSPAPRGSGSACSDIIPGRSRLCASPPEPAAGAELFLQGSLLLRSCSYQAPNLLSTTFPFHFSPCNKLYHNHQFYFFQGRMIKRHATQ